MAIATNDAIVKHDTLDTVSAGGGTSAVASAAYSASGDAAAWTNTEDVERAAFILKFQYPSGTITTGGIQLACRLLNNDGTTDEPPLTANWTGHALGSFVTGTGIAVTTDYAIVLDDVLLPNCKSQQEYEFYLKNSCGVTLTAGWTLKIDPKTDGPKA